MTDLLPNAAYQFTTKGDHHFNDSIALSAFVLRQVTHEANSNYNPVNQFVARATSSIAPSTHSWSTTPTS